MIEYETKHGCSFGTGINYNNYLHSYRDFNLFPAGKPVFEPPKPKIMSVEIPGSNGELDFSEALTGYIVYENRHGVLPYEYVGNRVHWDEVFHKLQKYIHGKKLKVVVDDDNYRYYEGRLTVDEPEYKNGRLYLTIEGDFYPYQLEKYSSAERWLWDPFPFSDGVVRNSVTGLVIDSPYVEGQAIEYYQSVTIPASDRPVVPDVIYRPQMLSDPTLGMSYYVGNELRSVTLTSGSNIAKIPDLIVKDEVTVYFIGEGYYVDIVYRGGCL